MWRRYLLSYRGQYPRLALAVVMAGGQSMIVLPVAWLVARVFDTSIPNRDLRGLFWGAAALFALNLVSMGLSLWTVKVTLYATKIVIRELRASLIRKLYAFSRSFYDRTDSSRLHSTIVQDSERVDVMSNLLVAQVLPGVFTGGVIAAVLLYLNPELVGIMAITAPLIVLVDRWFRPRLQARVRRFREVFDSFSSGVLFVLETVDLGRVQGAENTEMKRQARTLEALRIDSGRMSLVQSAYGLAQFSVSTIGSIVILVGGGIAVANETMTLGDLMSFYVVVGLLRSQVTNITHSYPYVVVGGQALRRLDELLLSDDVGEYRGSRRIEATGVFEFDHVAFDYGRECVLRDVDLCLRPGRQVAIVGANGSGKSTLSHLLCGFYRPKRGGIRADSHPYEELDIAHLRRSLAVVQQEPRLFSGTVLENITYGADVPDTARLMEACRRATALEVIESLPAGLETQVGDKGVRLSGGQRQRIAIARALYRQPRLLILDEPTNHLDAESIAGFLSNLRNVDRPPATLIISHDYRVVREADEVYELEAGSLTLVDEHEVARRVSLLRSPAIDPAFGGERVSS